VVSPANRPASPAAVGDGAAWFRADATDILILVGIYAVAQIALVLLAITYCSRARMASLLIGWFCLVYGALPVYYLAIALSSI
jgi:membrane glycosyltransferase